MNRTISRGEFLKIGGLSLAALAFRSLEPAARLLPPSWSSSSEMAGRVTRRSIDVYAEPDLQSETLRQIQRDTILALLEEITAPAGPRENPRWYRLAKGYVHSANIQRVDGAHLNPPLTSAAEGGQLGEVTVPYTQTIYKTRKGEWMSLYRLYYQSVHWITGVLESPSGLPWYRLTDERLRVHYYIPAEHMRPVGPEELAPISPDVPDSQKEVRVSIAEQLLTAYEGSSAVFQARVSTGRRWMETPLGEFAVERKFPSKHMGDGGLTADLHAYELVGVPWTTFFHPAGIAFHGTFWHDNYGTPMSQGCVNLRNEDARWLFRWLSPAFDPQPVDRFGWKLVKDGTRVTVF